MLAKKGKKKYWSGLQEPRIRDDNNEVFKPHLNFKVKVEGRGCVPTHQIIHQPHTPHLLTFKATNLPLILQHPPPSTPKHSYSIQNNHKHHFG